MKFVYRFLCALHFIVGIGAVAGGFAAVSNPKAPLGMPAETLKNSPFNDFLIPGIFLLAVLGIGNILCGLMFRLKAKYQGYVSSVLSWALVFWIVIQCIILQDVVFLHVLFFIIGVVMAGLSVILLFEKRLFPANIVLKLYEGSRKDM